MTLFDLLVLVISVTAYGVSTAMLLTVQSIRPAAAGAALMTAGMTGLIKSVTPVLDTSDIMPWLIVVGIAAIASAAYFWLQLHWESS